MMRIPSDISAANEKAVKDPFHAEHNAMGIKFMDGEITSEEWEDFKVEWEKRFDSSMAPVLKDRIYIEVSEDFI